MKEVVMIPVGRGDSWDFYSLEDAAEYFKTTTREIADTIRKGTIIAKGRVEYFLDYALPEEITKPATPRRTHKVTNRTTYRLVHNGTVLKGSLNYLGDLIGKRDHTIIDHARNGKPLKGCDGKVYMVEAVYAKPIQESH